jgi:hypothetical protein
MLSGMKPYFFSNFRIKRLAESGARIHPGWKASVFHSDDNPDIRGLIEMSGLSENLGNE